MKQQRARAWSSGVAGLAAFAAVLSLEARASACGASPGGPLGHSMCGLDDGPLTHRFRGAMSYSYSATRLSFGDGLKFDTQRQSTIVSFDYRLDKKTSLTFGVGGLLAGSLEGAEKSEFSGGPVGLVGYSVSLAREARWVPFTVLTIAGSFVHASTRASVVTSPFAQSVGYTALDARAGLLVGKTLLDPLSVYAAGRLFGGPAFWRVDGDSKIGTDIYHYQVGAGLLLRLPAGLELFFEGVPLGERGVVAGLGLTP